MADQRYGWIYLILQDLFACDPVGVKKDIALSQAHLKLTGHMLDRIVGDKGCTFTEPNRARRGLYYCDGDTDPFAEVRAACLGFVTGSAISRLGPQTPAMVRQLRMEGSHT